jgi:hypothetical protein
MEILLDQQALNKSLLILCGLVYFVSVKEGYGMATAERFSSPINNPQHQERCWGDVL